MIWTLKASIHYCDGDKMIFHFARFPSPYFCWLGLPKWRNFTLCRSRSKLSHLLGLNAFLTSRTRKSIMSSRSWWPELRLYFVILVRNLACCANRCMFNLRQIGLFLSTIPFICYSRVLIFFLHHFSYSLGLILLRPDFGNKAPLCKDVQSLWS